MGLTERHWFENEDVPENYEWALEDAVYNSRTKPSQIGKVGEVGMTLESAKEMDRRCVLNWLKDIIRSPTVAFNTYSDEHQIEFAHDAIVLLKEQEPKQVIKQTCHIKITTGYENPVVFTSYDWLCPTCKSLLCRGVDVIDDNYHYCKVCGQAVTCDEPPKEDD